MTDTIQFKVIDRRGKVHDVPSGLNQSSVMQALYDAGMDIEAACGGCCSCATCHVYLLPEDMGKFPERDDNERMLLEYSDHYDVARSRLSCQLALTADIDGLKIELAPED
jgi:2Fe-2S ferredoxin